MKRQTIRVPSLAPFAFNHPAQASQIVKSTSKVLATRGNQVNKVVKQVRQSGQADRARNAAYNVGKHISQTRRLF